MVYLFAILVLAGLVYVGLRLMRANATRPRTRTIGPDDDPDFLRRIGPEGQAASSRRPQTGSRRVPGNPDATTAASSIKRLPRLRLQSFEADLGALLEMRVERHLQHGSAPPVEVVDDLASYRPCRIAAARR